MLTEETKQILHELEKEIDAHDPVARNYKYRSFVSRSKGIRNGKRRYRKNWKDVELVSYQGYGWHQWHRFPFDETVTEALPGWEEWQAITYVQEKLRK